MRLATLFVGILILSTLLLGACSSTSQNSEKIVDNAKEVSPSDNQVVGNVIIPDDNQVEIGELI